MFKWFINTVFKLCLLVFQLLSFNSLLYFIKVFNLKYFKKHNNTLLKTHINTISLPGMQQRKRNTYRKVLPHHKALLATFISKNNILNSFIALLFYVKQVKVFNVKLKQLGILFSFNYSLI